MTQRQAWAKLIQGSFSRFFEIYHQRVLKHHTFHSISSHSVTACWKGWRPWANYLMCHALAPAAEGRGKGRNLQDAEQGCLRWHHTPKHTAFVDRYPLNALPVLRVIGHPLRLHMAAQAKSKNLSCRNFVFLLKSVQKRVSFPNDSGRFPKWPSNTLLNYWSSSTEGTDQRKWLYQRAILTATMPLSILEDRFESNSSLCAIYKFPVLPLQSSNSRVRANLMES